MEERAIGRQRLNSKEIRIKSIQANSLYRVNNKVEKACLDLGEAVLNESIFTDYMRKHGVAVNKRNRSKDFVVMKFDYGVKKIPKVLTGMTAKSLREYYYQNGATITWNTYDKEGNIVCQDTIHYKMLMRSTGKAKDGDCIFIRDNLHQLALQFITMDLYNRMPMENADIVGLSAYCTLITATALDYINIPMKNILIIKDEKVSAKYNAVSVKTKDVKYFKTIIDYKNTEQLINNYGFTFYKKKRRANPELRCIKKSRASLEEHGINIDLCPMIEKPYFRKECHVDRENEETEVSNILWDGMGVIDDSIFPEEKGMEGFIYCRSHFFKSCLFRGKIQEYFRDYYGDNYETTMITDMFGKKINITDVKVIITENSIKWIKFVDLMDGTPKKAYEYYSRWMKKYGEQFEIVKTAHSSKWGDLQRSSYQINNSLPCTDRDTLKNIAEVSTNFCNQMKTNHEAFIKYLMIDASLKYNINNVLIDLDAWNDNFKNTEYFKAKKNCIINEFKDRRLKEGKLLQYGDNLTICGNPIALLMKVTGQDFMKEPCFKKIENGIECYTTRFKNGERLAGFRSPHNSPNNIVALTNVYPEEIQRYFPQLGDNIIIINGIGTDVQSRLNGQDLDTDAIYTTNQPDIVRLAETAYKIYPTIINDIGLMGKSEYGKDMYSYAGMDSRISASQCAIGYASNIAQLALSYYYDSGGKDRNLEDTFIICSVLAQAAIDSAKRNFEVNVNSELNRLSRLPCMKRPDGVIYPTFYANIQMGKDDKIKSKIKVEEIGKFDCPMEILAELIQENTIDLRKNKQLIQNTYAMEKIFQYKPDGTRDSKQYKKVLSIVQEYDKAVHNIVMRKEKIKDKKELSKMVSREFDDCMLKINKLTISKGTMSSLIEYAFKHNGNVRDRLLTVLYDKDHSKFLNCFEKTPKTP